MKELKARYVKSYLIVITVLLFCAVPALAQVSFTNNETQFLAQNPNLLFQDFSGAPEALPQVCTNPATSNSNDGCFTPGRILEGIEFFVDPPGFNDMVLEPGNAFGDNNPPDVLVANIGDTSFDIIFTAGGINAVGFNAGCLSEGGPCSATVLVSVFGESGLLGTTGILATTEFNSFVGIITAEPITEIRILDGDVDTIQGVLNVWFGSAAPRNIPTLSEWGMIAAAAGLMLVGVFFAVRRRRYPNGLQE
jgi:hypothetical protein